ncbi:MAG: DUF2934 domain-containing protein [Acidobacteria bacterium]|nr:DUF2934 domain-containing protein [Acidobacteriota bacterium]
MHEEGQAYDHNTAAAPDFQEQIRQRAYALFQQRGSDGGDALSDWYRAEAEIRAALGASEVNNFSQTKNKAGSRRLTTWAF